MLSYTGIELEIWGEGGLLSYGDDDEMIMRLEYSLNLNE